MATSSVEDLPDSWEVADLDASMSRLMLSPSKTDSASSTTSPPLQHLLVVDVSASDSSAVTSNGGVSEDLVNSVDQFLREALQNPRERLSAQGDGSKCGGECVREKLFLELRTVSAWRCVPVLRMEQDVEKFIQDPTQQQMEFHQLPTSYLRLAAHRVAQHYSLQSMVLLDNNNLPDSSASRIIVRKTSESRLPLIRLAEIPVSLPTEDNGVSVVKVAIKQRPQKWSQVVNGANSHSKSNSSKSVEERKEEYNRARARIFNSSSTFSGGAGAGASTKPENEPRVQDRYQHVSAGVPKIEENSAPGGSDVNSGRGLIDSSSAGSSSRSSSSRAEKEPVGRFKTNNNRVAIFRDREVERKDPDFDRSYDRYAQRFDPGFGFNGGTYTIQPMYAPVLNYNSEFPQLRSAHRPPPISSEHHQHHRPLPQHLPPGPWAGPSGPAVLGGYGPETMMTPFNHHNHVGAHSASALYLHSAHYPCHRPQMPFIHPHEQLHQPFLQSHQQQHDAGFGLARPR
ncbi:hypothetical protein LguiB_015379 [Lonicera macranthoides]